MANQVTITFEGPLDSPNPNFKIHNGTTNSTIYCVGLSGKTAQFPITWDRIGEPEGTPKLTGTDGEDTEIATLYYHDYQAPFKPGETAYLKYGDPDFTGNGQSAVLVSAIEGARVYAEVDNYYPMTGEFKVIEGRMEAVITFP